MASMASVFVFGGIQVFTRFLGIMRVTGGVALVRFMAGGIGSGGTGMFVLHAVVLVVAHVLGDDPVEQAFFGLAEVGDRVPLRVACFTQRLERGLVQGLLAGTDLVQPLAVFGIGDRVGSEVHLGEARAAVVRGHAREFTGLVGDQVELGLHRSQIGRAHV